MRFGPALVALMACSGVTQGAPHLAQLRDGVWLQNGLRQYQRLKAHERLSEPESQDALTVTSYVCAVVDLEKYLAQRAILLAKALEEGKAKPTEPGLLDGMARAVPILIPLLKTDFVKAGPSCEQAFDMVRSFLDRYPEMLPKDADVIVDRALLAAYAKSDER
ncbi:MAG TPA: hypothetical protein VHB68_18780 [Steroidobacteraceae bacterium]|nr:hypothetical protein [Steroidobacteraceae bacterium]